MALWVGIGNFRVYSKVLLLNHLFISLDVKDLKIIWSKIQETMMLEDLRSLLTEIKLIKNYVLLDWENNRAQAQANGVCDELCITSLRF